MRRGARPGTMGLGGLLCLLSILLCAARAEETVVEVLGVRHRPAEELVGVLQPLAGPDGSVTSFGGRLIVRATPARLARIRELLKELDAPARLLRITVRQAADRRSFERGIAGESEASGSGRETQTLQVIEGSRAFIRGGRWVPLPPPPGVGPPVLAPGPEAVEAVSGFFVVPRLQGERVTLEIHAASESLDPGGGTEGHRVETTVSGRLGEWLDLGRLSSLMRSRDSGPLSAREREHAEDRRVLVRVEQAP